MTDNSRSNLEEIKVKENLLCSIYVINKYILHINDLAWIF